MEIIECKEKKEFLDNYTILKLLYTKDLYPHFTQAAYEAMLPDLLSEGYRQLMACIDGEVVGVAGFSRITRLYIGKVMRINDFVLIEEYRSQGIGKKLLHYIESEAQKSQCSALVLDTSIERKEAHKFYERHGFEVRAHHYIKRL